MIDVLEVIRDITARKREDKIMPDTVTSIELQSEVAKMVRDEVNQLVKSGVLKFGKTLNGVYLYEADKG